MIELCLLLSRIKNQENPRLLCVNNIIIYFILSHYWLQFYAYLVLTKALLVIDSFLLMFIVIRGVFGIVAHTNHTV